MSLSKFKSRLRENRPMVFHFLVGLLSILAFLGGLSVITGIVYGVVYTIGFIASLFVTIPSTEYMLVGTGIFVGLLVIVIAVIFITWLGEEIVGPNDY